MSRSLKAPDAAASEHASAPRLPDLQIVRILLVDDDPQAKALIDIALADAPFQHVLDVAGTAVAGVRQIRKDEHDVYLIDQQLPDGNGIDLIQNAKSEGQHKPFIL